MSDESRLCAAFCFIYRKNFVQSFFSAHDTKDRKRWGWNGFTAFEKMLNTLY